MESVHKQNTNQMMHECVSNVSSKVIEFMYSTACMGSLQAKVKGRKLVNLHMGLPSVNSNCTCCREMEEQNKVFLTQECDDIEFH